MEETQSVAIKNPQAIKRLASEYRDYLKNKKAGKITNFKLSINEDNLFNIYFIIFNLDEPYKNGEYMGLISFQPDKYPYKAPTIQFFTPSGRFTPYTKICTTFTHFHNEQWSPAWTIESIMMALISFMYDDNDSGVGSINIGTKEREILAEKSKEFNLNHDIYKKYFIKK